MSVLVVVDMQRSFPAANCRSTQARVRRLVRSHRGPVVLVEFADSGPTLPGIERACKCRYSFIRCVKNLNDGGAHVASALLNEGLGRHSRFVVCGVNTGYCVTETANGILRNLPRSRVEIDFRGCRDALDDPGTAKCVSMALLDVWVREDPSRRSVVW